MSCSEQSDKRKEKKGGNVINKGKKRRDEGK
jgi:hypothetical protein